MKKTLVFFFCCAWGVLSSALPAPAIRLAIVDFQNLTTQPKFDYLSSAIPQLLVTDLKPAKKIELIERSQLDKVLQEHQLGQSGAVDEKTAVKIGQLVGANHLLLGAVFQTDDLIRLDARLVEIASGRITLAEKVTTSKDNDLIDAIDELATLIMAKLTDETPAIATDSPETFQAVAGEVLAVYTALDNRYKLVGSDDPNYLLIDVQAGKMSRQQERIPLNICMVIDKSGSMQQENKLENVKKAALFVVDHLKPSDYFSVITYDTHVYNTIPATRAESKEALKSAISEIVSGSSTNLSGGLMEGYAQVLANQKSGMVNRVLLLSDGLANSGITDPLRLKNIAKEKNSLDLTLSTFGVGSDFNEDLMTSLAEFGGGNYYFIDNLDDISTIFSQELFGLLSVVAQNASIRLDLREGVTCMQTFGYPCTQSGRTISVKLNDVFSEEEKTVLFKLSVPAGSNTPLTVGELQVVYDDVVLKNDRVIKSYQPTLTATGEVSLLSQGKNLRVHDNITLYKSATMLDQAIVQADQRAYEKAETINAQNLDFLQKQLSQDSPKRLKQQILNVMKYKNDLQQAENMKEDEQRLMQKDAKYQNYNQMKKK